MEIETIPYKETSRHNSNQESVAEQSSKPKIVVIMGATGAGKSKLAIDLASHFPVEIINADSMQVYHGLDVLTNKVPVEEQKGVPHHLLGTISPNVEFTAKDFRDAAIRLIDEIRSRNCLPVIVGGTNYYIQALVSQFLLDDHTEDAEANCSLDLPGDIKNTDVDLEPMAEDCDYTHIRLKELDPIAANRIHPNDHRKIKQYLSLYSRLGEPPSKLFQGNTMENWGRIDNLKYDCCFICVDASLSALDEYVDRRVDLMVNAGLLQEVCDIYKLNADYTRGLRQAIGVREFKDFLIYCNSHPFTCEELSNVNARQMVESFGDNQTKLMLKEAICKVKLNTRRLVRRQKRRLSRLQMLYGWKIHYVDVAGCLSGNAPENLWDVDVVQPCVKMVKTFLDKSICFEEIKVPQRDLWTLHVCEVDIVLWGICVIDCMENCFNYPQLLNFTTSPKLWICLRITPFA